MSLDETNCDISQCENELAEDRRIYASETGTIRIEARHFRRTFEPEKFVALLRQMFRKLKSSPSAPKQT